MYHLIKKQGEEKGITIECTTFKENTFTSEIENVFCCPFLMPFKISYHQIKQQGEEKGITTE